MNEVLDIDRIALLNENTKRNSQTIFVCHWHPSLYQISSILKENFHLIQSDKNLSEIFTERPSVAYRRPQTIERHIVKNDMRSQPKKEKITIPCGSCKLCPSISKNSTITNTRKNITVEPISGGTCRTKCVVYAARCKKCDLIYIGHTSNEIRERFGKHRYDVNKRPSNTEYSEHFGSADHTEKDMEVTILQSGIWNDQEREFHEDKWICRLQTATPNGINKSMKQYAKSMYTCYKNIH